MRRAERFFGMFIIAAALGAAGCSGAPSSGTGSKGSAAKGSGGPDLLDSSDPAVGIWVAPSFSGGNASFDTLMLRSDGVLVSGEPTAADPRDQDCEAAPTSKHSPTCGTWTRTGDEIELTLASGKQETCTYRAKNDDVSCGGDDPYLRARPVGDTVLAGTFYRNSSYNGGYSPPGQTTTLSSSKSVTLSPDGRFKATQFSSVTDVKDPVTTGEDTYRKTGGGDEAEGTYAIADYTITFTTTDGVVASAPIWLLADSKNAPLYLYIGTYGYLFPPD